MCCIALSCQSTNAVRNFVAEHDRRHLPCERLDLRAVFTTLGLRHQQVQRLNTAVLHPWLRIGTRFSAPIRTDVPDSTRTVSSRQDFRNSLDYYTFSTSSITLIVVSQALYGVSMGPLLVASFTEGLRNVVKAGYPDDISTSAAISSLYQAACSLG